MRKKQLLQTSILVKHRNELAIVRKGLLLNMCRNLFYRDPPWKNKMFESIHAYKLKNIAVFEKSFIFDYGISIHSSLALRAMHLSCVRYLGVDSVGVHTLVQIHGALHEMN